tara:strand:- start:108 stop:632 length:525 start_codon:yes stop_codon:yes gene_type:complete
MKTQNIERYLESFGKQVVNRAKGNLQKAKGGGTNLENSISFKVISDANGFTVQFFMDSYGTYVDKGVSGNKQARKFKDYKGQVKSSPYKYTTKQPPSRVLDKWIVKKGIAPRDEKGRFITRKSISFLIARSIKINGIKSTSFFQKPLGLGLKQFGNDLLGAVKEDIIEGLTTVN